MPESPNTQSHRAKKLSAYAAIAGSIATVAIVALVILFGMKGTGPRSLKMDLGNGQSINLTVKDNKITFVEILTKIMNGKDVKSIENRANALSILAGRYNIFEYGSDQYIDKIGNDVSDSSFSKKIIELVKQKRGPFKETNFFDLDNPDQYVNIDRLEYNHPFITTIRQKILNGSNLFWPADYSVQVYESSDIPRGTAAICENSEFRGNKIRLFKPNIAIPVFVFAKYPLNRPECAETPNNIIQLHPFDARKMIGGAYFHGPETAFATAEARNYTLQPITPNQADIFQTVYVSGNK